MHLTQQSRSTFIFVLERENIRATMCMCPLYSPSLIAHLILDQQTLLSIPGNRSDFAVLSEKVGQLAKVELGQKDCDKLGKVK